MLNQFEFMDIRAGPRREAQKQALQVLHKFTGSADELLDVPHALWQLHEREFRCALTLAPETDFFIRKAIGWALWDHARTQPDAVRVFLARHAEQLSGLTRREAGKHLGEPKGVVQNA